MRKKLGIRRKQAEPKTESVRPWSGKPRPGDIVVPPESTDTSSATATSKATATTLASCRRIARKRAVQLELAAPLYTDTILAKDDKKTIALVDPGDLKQTKVIVKYTTNDEYIEPYKKEAQIYTDLKSTENPNIISMYGSGKAEKIPGSTWSSKFEKEGKKFRLLLRYKVNNFYLLLEYEENNKELSSYIRSIPRPGNIDVTKEIFHKVINAMINLHSGKFGTEPDTTIQKLMHNDLHSDNVMFNSDTKAVKIFDFDLSYSFTDPGLPFTEYYYDWPKNELEVEPDDKDKYLIYVFLFDLWKLWVSIYLLGNIRFSKDDEEVFTFKGFTFKLKDFHKFVFNNSDTFYKDNFILGDADKMNIELANYQVIKNLYRYCFNNNKKG